MLPIDVTSPITPSEEIRLRHRHLDLKRPQMAFNLKLRSIISSCVRNYLTSSDFIEVETPTLFKSTPEGAREFLVPTRQKGKFYALPQSPQQYKQLLIAGGVERYFQMARCYRDENGRADRQPEFTQIDIEVAYSNPETIKTLIEGMIRNIWETARSFMVDQQQHVHDSSMNDMNIPPLSPKPFETISYDEALSKYGVDKPDRRFGLLIEDISECVSSNTFNVINSIFCKNGNGNSIRAINATGLGDISRKIGDQFQPIANQMKALATERNGPSHGNIVLVRVQQDMSWKSRFTKIVPPTEQININEKMMAKPGDLLLISFGVDYHPCRVLGQIRLHCASLLKVNKLYN